MQPLVYVNHKVTSSSHLYYIITLFSNSSLIIWFVFGVCECHVVVCDKLVIHVTTFLISVASNSKEVKD